MEKRTKTPGDRVRELRHERGWTQAELAKLADVSQQNVSDVERGKIDSPHTLHLIAQAFGVSTDYLHTGTGPRRASDWAVLADLERMDQENRETALLTIGSLAAGLVEAHVLRDVLLAIQRRK